MMSIDSDGSPISRRPNSSASAPRTITPRCERGERRARRRVSPASAVYGRSTFAEAAATIVASTVSPSAQLERLPR